MTLFRNAAIEGRRRGLHGEVTVHQPVSFQVITAILALVAIAAAGALSFVSFSRKETAPGWVIPSRGMAETYAQPGALVQAIEVEVGQKVGKGDVLGSVSMETYDAKGALSEQERKQVAAQISELDAQIAAGRYRRGTEVNKTREQIAALTSTVGELEEQKRLQQNQLEVARRQYAGMAPLVARGFVSKFDQDRREQTVLSLQQAVSGLDRQIQEQRGQLASLQAEIMNAGTQQTIDESQLRASRANLSLNAAGIAARSGSIIRSPTAGTVAAVNLRVGETVKPGLPVISIAPPGQLAAELLLPTRSSGFVRAGQQVRLFVDAFPYQRYGAIYGVVEEVSSAAVNPGQYSAPISFQEPSYRVRIRLGDFKAGNHLLALKPGMTLTASIVADRRTLLQWLFDPIFAVRETLAG